jgi:hypothetical protein
MNLREKYFVVPGPQCRCFFGGALGSLYLNVAALYTLSIMTDKQIERIKARIEKYNKALAADKIYWGGQYHDGQGIQYLIPEQFIKIRDYKGGQRYLNWFDKNFPGDGGYPIFLFERTSILFKCDKLMFYYSTAIT